MNTQAVNLKHTLDRIDAAQLPIIQKAQKCCEDSIEYEEYLNNRVVQLETTSGELRWAESKNGKWRILFGDRPLAECKMVDRAHLLDELPRLLEAIARNCEGMKRI